MYPCYIPNMLLRIIIMKNQKPSQTAHFVNLLELIAQPIKEPIIIVITVEVISVCVIIILIMEFIMEVLFIQFILFNQSNLNSIKLLINLDLKRIIDITEDFITIIKLKIKEVLMDSIVFIILYFKILGSLITIIELAFIKESPRFILIPLIPVLHLPRLMLVFDHLKYNQEFRLINSLLLFLYYSMRQ